MSGTASGSSEPAGAGPSPDGSAPDKPGSNSDGKSDRPHNWDDIAAGHNVVAHDSPTEGWYDAVVIERTGDMLTMRWRDYPRERRFSQHRFAVALLFPGDLSATPSSGATSKKPGKTSSKNSPKEPSSPAGSFPATWHDIDIDHLVLAKDDGPWRSWWEAIPTQKTGDNLVLRWRDFSQVPPVVRSRLSLALLHPKP
jgi:hypothetical protein